VTIIATTEGLKYQLFFKFHGLLLLATEAIVDNTAVSGIAKYPSSFFYHFVL